MILIHYTYCYRVIQLYVSCSGSLRDAINFQFGGGGGGGGGTLDEK